jgi:hypothetical protein
MNPQHTLPISFKDPYQYYPPVHVYIFQALYVLQFFTWNLSLYFFSTPHESHATPNASSLLPSGAQHKSQSVAQLTACSKWHFISIPTYDLVAVTMNWFGLTVIRNLTSYRAGHKSRGVLPLPIVVSVTECDRTASTKRRPRPTRAVKPRLVQSNSLQTPIVPNLNS